MKFLAYLHALAARLFQHSRVDEELEEELRSHIQHRADDLERSGLDRPEAERRARIEFGGRGRYQEECREELGGTWLETLLQDARFSFRVFCKSPGFAIVAVVTLALAIGANAVVFGIMDALVLRPLNVPQSENLWGTAYGNNPMWQSYPNYLDLRDRNHSFTDLAAFKFVFVGLSAAKEASLATGFATTGNYFDVLKVQPYLGRFFHSSDEHGPNSAPYVVLSYEYWHSHFLDDRAVVGRMIQLNKHPFTVVGVAQPGFQGTLLFISPNFFMPIANQEQVDGEPLLNARANSSGIFEAVGHLKPGVTPTQAIADVNAVGDYLEKTYPKDFGHRSSSLVKQGLTSFGGPVKAFVAALMLLAGLILLAACANLGGLFAARAADRSREVALRLALGSSRYRILQGLFTEAVLVSLVGGAAGLVGSIALLLRLSVWEPFPGAPLHIPVSPDANVYLVALALALVSGFLFGLVPVRQVLRTDPYQIVKAGSASRAGRRMTVRDILLVLQIAICGVLVTSSLVAVVGLTRSLYGHFGFEPRNTMLAGVNLAMAGYRGDAVLDMQKRMIHAMEIIPGVDSAALVNNYPPLVYLAGRSTDVFKEETSDLRPTNASLHPYFYDVSPEYFGTARTALLAGRSFSWYDDKNTAKVAIVNRDFARKMFGSVTSAIGRYYKTQAGVRIQIVGVVEDGKYQVLTEDQRPAIFLPFLQSPLSFAYLLVRSTRDPQQIAAAMRSKLHELDEGLPVDTQTWNNLLTVVQFPSRVATMALGVLGTMGALLSITGIFGMAAFSVSKRRKELGIRMALGAQRKEVLQSALGRAFNLLAFGSTAGLILGILASRVLASIVYQATPRDPLVLTGVVFAMAFMGLLATWVPAQRALSLDPLTLLRED
jgi:predicted permease